MSEEVDVSVGTGRDKIKGIEETPDSVVVNYVQGEQVRPIVVPMEIINFVRDTIDNMEVGERYASKYLYNHYIRHFRIQSEIVRGIIEVFKKALNSRDIDDIIVNGIIDDVLKDDKSLMTFEEFIGVRKIKDSHYFKVYAAIRYWKEKGKIMYNSKGSIWRVL